MCHHHSADDHTPSPVDLTRLWRPEDAQKPAPVKPGASELYRPDILATIEAKIKELDPELRELSLDIHCASSLPPPLPLPAKTKCDLCYCSAP